MSPILVKPTIEGFVEHKYYARILIFNFDPIISRGFLVDIIRKKPT
jgi:hypothetical protein